MVKKSGEMARYYGSEALRNKKLQDKVGDYVVEKGTKYAKKAFSAEMDELSTKIRPDKPYKTNRKDLGGPIPETYKKNGKVYLKEPYKGKKRGKGIEEELSTKVNDILINRPPPPKKKKKKKYKQYQ